MKNKKLTLIISALALAAILLGSITCYKAVFCNSEEDSVKILGYRAAEERNVNGYLMTKYENIESTVWIDSDNIIILKNNGEFNNPGSSREMSTISKYDLNSREMRDYADVIMDSKEFHGISKSGRYVLYGEPRIIPEVGGKEWEKAAESKELFHEKRDILDLDTGEIVQDFDKMVNNCSASYKWMDNDMIFVDYGSEWHILDRGGKSIMQGAFNYDNCAYDFTNLVDVSEIKVSEDGISGCFYYTKEFMGDDGNLGERIYGMDVNTHAEKLIYSCEHSMDYAKQGDTIILDSFDNNGEATKGVYTNRTFGFKAVNIDGTLLQDYGFPKGKSYKDLVLSPDGQKCAFIERNGFIEDGGDEDLTTMKDTLKVMNIKTGEVKDVAKVEDLIDRNREEEFIKDQNGFRVINGEKRECKGPGPVISNVNWDEKGESLTFNYLYTSKEDSNNHTNTYVVTFDK